jgi:Centromere protein B dimerisation domain
VSRGRRQKGPGQRGQRDTPKGFYTDRDGSEEEEEGSGRRLSAKRKRRGQEDDEEDSDEDEEEEEEDNSSDDSEDDDDDEEEKDSGPSNWSCTVQHCIRLIRTLLFFPYLLPIVSLSLVLHLQYSDMMISSDHL